MVNVGTVTLTDAVVSDDALGGTICSKETLAPGSSFNCSDSIYLVRVKTTTEKFRAHSHADIARAVNLILALTAIVTQILALSLTLKRYGDGKRTFNRPIWAYMLERWTQEHTHAFSCFHGRFFFVVVTLVTVLLKHMHFL